MDLLPRSAVGMGPSRWEKIENVFNEAVQAPAHERASAIRKACGADADLYAEIVSLLDADTHSDEILEQSVFPLVARLLDDDFDGLLAGSDFASYRLKKLLGKGGMGAVFLAEDMRLRRPVALKVLPPALAKDEMSVSRFRKEAFAASSISHPNIAHIYEFGESGDHLYIAMEYVEGRTVRQLITEKAVSPSQALGIAKQTALALESTHRRGVIHRDIKPENIIVKEDGLVKVLDFGLAKLNDPEKPDGELSATTNTQMGVVLGTVGYMSPEQVRGQKLDASTDLWSLGVVLFEMLTGSRPFQGPTPSDVQAAILKDEPLGLCEIGCAPKFDQILRKALAKNTNERYRSASDFARDIEQLQAEFDPSFHDSHRYYAVTAGSNALEETSSKDQPRRRNSLLLLPPVMLLAVVAWLGYQFSGLQRPAVDDFVPMRVVRLTNSGSAAGSAISPDGQLLAFILEEAGKRGIYLRRRNEDGSFAPESTVVVAPVPGRRIRGVTFGPAARQIYFRAITPSDARYHMYSVPVEGGEARKVVENAESIPSFSPDGAQMVFLRTNEDNSRGHLIIADADGTSERIFQTRTAPDFFDTEARPSWSPDGMTIICSAGTKPGDRSHMLPVAFQVSDGSSRPVLSEPWLQIWWTRWVKGGSAFVMTGRRDGTTDNNQLWLVTYPGGEVTRLTNDFNDYFGVSVSETTDSSGVELTSVILSRTSQLWKMNIEGPPGGVKQITHSGGDDGYGISFAQAANVYYGSTAAGNPDIWMMDPYGSDRRQLTTDPHLDSQPYATPDGRFVVFTSLRSGIESLWRMNPDGTGQTIVAQDAVREPLALTRDGWVYHHSTRDGAAGMWRVRVEDGKLEKIKTGEFFPSAVSPDGKSLLAGFRSPQAKTFSLAVLSIDGDRSDVLKELKAIEGAEIPGWIRWSPDGGSVVYIAAKGGVDNLWSHPLDGTAPKQLTNFANDRIYSFDISPDGQHIIYSRGHLAGYVVQLTNQ